VAAVPLYFLTLCTHDRGPIPANEATHESFLLFCELAPQPGAFVGRYVLMPDYLHRLVTFDREETSLSDWVKSCSGQKWNSVVANPVRPGLTLLGEDWPYAGAIHEVHFSRRS
jgi:hypothetical protein